MLVQAHVSIFFCQGFYNLIFSIEIFKQPQVVICLSLAEAYGVRGKSKYFFSLNFNITKKKVRSPLFCENNIVTGGVLWEFRKSGLKSTFIFILLCWASLLISEYQLLHKENRHNNCFTAWF